MCQPGRPGLRGVPAGFSGFGPLPQREIKGMTLAAFSPSVVRPLAPAAGRWGRDR